MILFKRLGTNFFLLN